eukprot:GHVS01034044.1.p3 GENE.GHVS01034044.1~~GHVS01034044.1.p3  ORF type:complete len:111 (-),score=23.24 GHVS01034044.1:75-407(-)
MRRDVPAAGGAGPYSPVDAQMSAIPASVMPEEHRFSEGGRSSSVGMSGTKILSSSSAAGRAAKSAAASPGKAILGAPDVFDLEVELAEVLSEVLNSPSEGIRLPFPGSPA